MKICIPSYKRPDVTTLKLLSAFKVEDIYIFLNNYDSDVEMKADAKLYKEKVFEYLKDEVNIIELHTHGISQARNAILNFWPQDTEIVMLDDDIQSICQLTVNKKLAPMDSNGIKMFFQMAFSNLRRNYKQLWGVYPVANGFFMNGEVKNGFIIGTCFGVINSRIRFDENLKLKEDYDFTLSHIAQGGVARFNFITVKAKHYTNKGGCQNYRTDELEAQSAEYLLKKWPKLVKLNPKRANEILI